MSFFKLVGVEYKKIRRSYMILILLTAVVILWIPSICNAHLNFKMQAEGISPEYNFFIQGFLGLCWFLFPASMVVCTVLLIQTERSSRGILKMLSLPVGTGKLCLAKFTVLLSLAALQIILTVGMYTLSAWIVSRTQKYDFLLQPAFIWKEAGMIFLSAIPMLACYWMLAVCIQTPIFSIGAGLASVVPSVLVINTKAWFLYPMAYPFYIITSEYSRLAEHLSDFDVQLIPWLPAAGLMTAGCLGVSCMCFGRAERR